MKRFKNRINRTHHAEMTFVVKHTMVKQIKLYQILPTCYKYTGVSQALNKQTKTIYVFFILILILSFSVFM